MVWLAVGVAAGVGAVLRYLVDRGVARRWSSALPIGTFLVNVSGSLVLGFVVGMAAHHGLTSTWVDVLGAGFAGGYTTLSTWAWETLALAESDGLPTAAANIVGSVFVGLLAGAAGLGLSRL